MPVRRHLAFCLVLAVAAACSQDAAATEPVHPAPASTVVQPLHRRLKVSIGYHFSSGDYGDDDTTTINYVPLVITAEISRFTFQGTISYLRLSGPPGSVNVPGGGPVVTDGEGDGLGDLFARTAYLLPRRATWPIWVPFVDVGGLVKFPTASRSDGLGTGEFDFGIEGNLTWGLERLTPFASVGYRFRRDPPDTDLRNTVMSSIGAMYRIFDTLNAGLLLDYRQASSSSTGEQLDIVPFVGWKFIRPWSLEIYASAGLAKGSPDAGVGTQLGYTW